MIFGEYQDYEIRNSALHNERWTSNIDGPWWTKVSIIPIFWSTRINFTSSCRWWSWVQKTMSKTVHLSLRRPKCVFFPLKTGDSVGWWIVATKSVESEGFWMSLERSSMVLAQELLWILRASDAHPYLLSRPHLGAIRCDGSSFLGSLGGKKRVRWQFPAILGELVKLLFIAILDGSSTLERTDLRKWTQ